MTHPQQRFTPEQRRQLEEEEERREAERLAELARQRAVLAETEHDTYVIRRVEGQMAAVSEAQRREHEEELEQTGGGEPVSPYLLLGVGLLISVALLLLIGLLGRG